MTEWLSLIGVMIPIVAILMPVAIVFIALYFRHQRQVSLHETIKHLADKGMPIPKDLLDPPLAHRASDDPSGTPRRRSPLYAAMTTLGVGIGLMLFFYIMDMGGLWGIGALVATIGVAQLIAIAIDRQSGPARERSGE